jgi:mannitol/fructose-specific phosphotransferase system IIA component (Ntr-type)
VKLLDYLNRECVKVSLAATDKDSALNLMVDLVVERELVQDRKRLLEALRQREEVVSTGIGNGIAIPHADLPEIGSPCLAIGVFPDGVDFDSLDEEPVHLVFLLLGTPRTPGLHMKILARIARLSKDSGFGAGLRRAQQPSELLEVLEEIESRR